MTGWVYIISNRAMPDILKIGYTEPTPQIRAYELYNTGCPYPYKVDYAVYVSHPYEVEQKAHELQINTNVGKEWFSCSYSEAIETIDKAIKLCGATIEIDRKQPKPTSEELNTIIQQNPSAEQIIRDDQIEENNKNLNLFLNDISHLSNIDKREKIKERERIINKEYDEKLRNIKEPFIMKFKTFLYVLFIFIIGGVICYNDIVHHVFKSLPVAIITFGIGSLFYSFVGFIVFSIIFLTLGEVLPSKIVNYFFSFFETESERKYHIEYESLIKERDLILEKLNKNSF